MIERPALIRKILRRSGIFCSEHEHLDLTDLTSGLLNWVYLARTMDKPRVIRIRHFTHPEYGQEFAAERSVYPLLSGGNVRVPELYFVQDADAVIPYGNAIFEYVEGVRVDEMLVTGGSSSRQAMLTSLSGGLAHIHTVTRDRYGTHRAILEPMTCGEFFGSMFSKEEERLWKVSAKMCAEFVTAARRWVAVLNSLPEVLTRPTLVHGDIHGRNLIFERSTAKTAFLDWEASRFRIGAYDFAQIGYVNGRNEPRLVDVLVLQYLDVRGLSNLSMEFKQAVAICSAFWHLRMGLFQLQFPDSESEYFGNAEGHLRMATSYFSRT